MVLLVTFGSSGLGRPVPFLLLWGRLDGCLSTEIFFLFCLFGLSCSTSLCLGQPIVVSPRSWGQQPSRWFDFSACTFSSAFLWCVALLSVGHRNVVSWGSHLACGQLTHPSSLVLSDPGGAGFLQYPGAGYPPQQIPRILKTLLVVLLQGFQTSPAGGPTFSPKKLGGQDHCLIDHEGTTWWRPHQRQHVREEDHQGLWSGPHFPRHCHPKESGARLWITKTTPPLWNMVVAVSCCGLLSFSWSWAWWKDEQFQWPILILCASQKPVILQECGPSAPLLRWTEVRWILFLSSCFPPCSVRCISFMLTSQMSDFTETFNEKNKTLFDKIDVCFRSLLRVIWPQRASTVPTRTGSGQEVLSSLKPEQNLPSLTGESDLTSSEPTTTKGSIKILKVLQAFSF